MLDPAALAEHLANLPSLSDEAAYLVFADWLQTQNHPWGELIVLQHRAAHAATQVERDDLWLEAEIVLEQHHTAIVGALAAEATSLVWRAGFLRSAMLAVDAELAAIVGAVKALRALPIGMRLESLQLAPRPATFTTTRSAAASTVNIVDPWTDWDAIGPVLANIPHIELGTTTVAAAAYVRMPRFDDITRWLRDLTHLAITGAGRDDAGRLELPALRSLEVRFSHATRAQLAPLAELQLPALERFALGLGGRTDCILDDCYPPEDYDENDPDRLRYPATYDAATLDALDAKYVTAQNVSIESVRAVLAALPPTVVELDLSSSALGGNLLAAIVNHPRVHRLHRLVLSACALRDPVAPILIDAAPALAALEHLDLSRNALTSRTTTQLSAVLPNAVLDGQTDSGRPDFFMRYVGTME